MLTSNSNNKKNRVLKKISLRRIDDNEIHDGRILHKNSLAYNFSSNDYLGLSKNPNLVKGSIDWSKKYGTSLSSSRLITGNVDFIEQIEQKVKYFYKAQECLIFGSGYQLNITAIPSIFANISSNSKECIILSDKLNHASINIGCKISGHKTLRYKHLDMNHLESLLLKYKNIKNKLIVSESVFSMDGDVIDIKSIRLLAQKFNCYLYLDEAHAVGVIGENGFGITEQFKQKNDREITTGTFSKAFGAFGSFICCSSLIKKNLVNYCSGFIYTTALPPNVLGSIYMSLNEMPKLSQKRKKLLENSNFMRAALNDQGFSTLNSKTNIIPVLNNSKTNYEKICKHLLKEGFFTSLIRPPTVPFRMDRIRLSLTSHINKEIIIKFLKVLKDFEK